MLLLFWKKSRIGSKRIYPNWPKALIFGKIAGLFRAYATGIPLDRSDRDEMRCGCCVIAIVMRNVGIKTQRKLTLYA
jgi:hypothetical protein